MSQPNAVSPDTQAVLLLCGRFGLADSGLRPLSNSEYNRLAQWLQGQELRPADLLDVDKAGVLLEGNPADLESSRLGSLLGRGAALALSLDDWLSNGLWIISRSDLDYPRKLKAKLGRSAPPLLWGVGDPKLLAHVGVCVVGARDADEDALTFTRRFADRCAKESLAVVSGGARGVDSAAMVAALDRGGRAIGVLAENLARTAVSSHFRQALRQGNLVLVSPFHPKARFEVGNAMARNKYIYGLSTVAVVVSAAAGSGGTWAGAEEDLRNSWVPLFVRVDPKVPPGNRDLVKKGGIALDPSLLDEPGNLMERLTEMAERSRKTLGGDTDAGLAGSSDAASRKLPSSNGVWQPSSPLPSTGSHAASGGHSNLDAFDLLWPHLEFVLGEERAEGELAEMFNVHIGQMKDWLKRAMSQGLVTKAGKPARYRSRQHGVEPGQLALL